MARSRRKDTAINLAARSYWPKATELVGLKFTLKPFSNGSLYPQYTIGLHAWFLQQIQAFDPELSACLHNGESEKSFSLSGLNGQFTSHSQSLQLLGNKPYRWRVNGLSGRTVQGLAVWLRHLPNEMDLNHVPLLIESVRLARPATTYHKLYCDGKAASGTVSLSFASPTSFRRKGHHMPLPWPTNVFQSYLRRWNHFAPQKIDQGDFLDWIDNHVIIQQHQISSMKVAAGKQGSVTGFTGAVTYMLDHKAAGKPDYQAMFYALTQLGMNR